MNPPIERDADGWGFCGPRYRSLGPKFYYTTDPTKSQEKNAKKNKKIIFTKRLDKYNDPCYNVGTTSEGENNHDTPGIYQIQL